MKELPWHMIETLAVILLLIARLVRNGWTLEKVVEALKRMLGEG